MGFVGEDGDDDDLRRRPEVEELPQGHLPAHHRHLHVEDDHIRHVHASQIHGLPPVRGLRDHLHPGVGGSGRDHRTEGSTLEQEGTGRAAGADGKATEIAAAWEAGEVTRKASRRASPLRHGRFQKGGLLYGSLLPPGYALDASDPDALLLLRADGTTAAMFSARGVTVVGILEAAGQDAQAANHVGRETLSAPNGRQT